MLSLSTSFISTHVSDGGRLLKALERFDINGVELDCRLSRSQFETIKTHIGASRLRVGSLHNYCPFPALKPGIAPSGDYFKLSSLDTEERKLAVQWTQRTIEHANHMEADAVVLHCGAVEMENRHEDLYRLLSEGKSRSPEFEELMTRELANREMRKSPFMDALMFSLDRLLPVAENQGVTLGLENRNHYFELPGADELRLIFSEFRGAPLGYWHDTGHAHISELMGIISQRQLFQTFADQLVGMHLHDACGLDDHRAPGNGEIDFEPLKPQLNDDHHLVIELAPGTLEADVYQAVAYIRNLGEFRSQKSCPDFFS